MTTDVGLSKMLWLRRAKACAFVLSATLMAWPLACSEDEVPTDGVYGPRTRPAKAWINFQKLDVPGASRVTDFAFVPGTTDEFFVTSQGGDLRHYKLRGSSAQRLGEAKIPDMLAKDGCGLLSIAPAPNFAQTRFVYTSQCIDPTTNRIVRHTLTSLDALAASGTEILTITNPETPTELWHRWGSMGFEPDGETLWVTMGDNKLDANGQDPRTKQATLLRIKPSQAEATGGFVPAEGNMAGPDADPAVYAYGLRSSWRVSRDRFGRFWIGDVGARAREEVNLVTAAGQNFGWNKSEGRCTEDCEGVVQPLVDWGRKSDEPYVLDDPDTEPETRRTVWVGESYEPDAPGAPPDRYFGYFNDVTFFGDYFAGWVRGMKVDAQGVITTDKLFGHLPRITTWRRGPDGYMYVATLSGTFYRVVLAED